MSKTQRLSVVADDGSIAQMLVHASPATVPPIMIEQMQHNVAAVKSTSMGLVAHPATDVLAWYDWACAFAREHGLRVTIVTPDRAPKRSADRTLLLGRERMFRLYDGRSLAYRALKLSVDCSHINEADRELSRKLMADAHFDLEARTMEPFLQMMSPADAVKTRKLMRAIWDAFK
jgi:hypothetical protein